MATNAIKPKKLGLTKVALKAAKRDLDDDGVENAKKAKNTQMP